ncbi:MAG: hypothetical protein H0T79_07345, partial [Deltaproteobacteria bacterium]|nr:hypothetical protein [Deltaproteobacteria bacterium]
SSPFVCLVARQALPDTPLLACIIGALAMFTLANEDGDRALAPIGHLQIPWTHHRVAFDARHVVFALAGGFVAGQAVYYLLYFTWLPQLAVSTWVRPGYLPFAMGVLLVALARDGWLIVRLPIIAIGGVGVELHGATTHARLPGQSWWRYTFDAVVPAWERHSPDRYLVRAVSFPFVWAYGGSWETTDAVAGRLLRVKPLTTMRQVYLLWCYAFIGISVLAKGPPGLAVVAGVIGLHTVLLWRWRAMYEGALELKRGILLAIATFMPWHIAMWLKDGSRFIDEYLVIHILNRATVGVDSSPGTFQMYTTQLGHGMWLWAALLPAALAAAVLRARLDTRAGRVRFTITVWAVVTVAFYGLVQTKFHHYILPAVPPLALLVACFLDDLLAGRERLHPLLAGLGAGIVLLVARDLAFEPERWIEMFVFRDDRPWPHGAPWSIDVSDGFIALGIVAAVALLVATRWVRLGIAALGVVGLAICVWSLQVYMPIAGTHWGMRDAIRTYYEQRTIYGHKTVYFGIGQLHDAWRDHDDHVRFETFVPTALQVGQPMTITLQVNDPDDEHTKETEYTMLGAVSAIEDHAVEVTLRPNERGRLRGAIARGAADHRVDRKRPVTIVDADRLLAWQLYWRGENFWSADEIWGWAPELKTAFKAPDNLEFLRYLADRTRAPLGRRYFLVTDANKIPNVKPSLPGRALRTFEVIDTSSNKFTLAAFWL